MALLIAALVAFGQTDRGDFFTYNLINTPICLTPVVIGFWTSTAAAVRSVG